MTVSLQMSYYDISWHKHYTLTQGLNLFGIKTTSATSRSKIGMVQGSHSTGKNVNAYENSITRSTSEVSTSPMQNLPRHFLIGLMRRNT